jgi:hypothetical protein
MSLLTLPPIWQHWSREDLEDLTLEEVERLYASLYNKLYDVVTQFEQDTIFYKRNEEKILRKERARGKFAPPEQYYRPT